MPLQMPPRYRARTTYRPYAVSAVREYNNSGTLLSTSYQPNTPWTTLETMHDDPRLPKRVKLVFHDKLRVTSFLGMRGWSGGTGYNDWTELSYPYHLPVQQNLCLGLLPMPSIVDSSWAGVPVNPTDAVAAAANEFQPIAEEFSLLNSLLELGDVSRLAQQMRDLRGALLSTERIFRRSSDGTVNAFLAYNFGILPMMSDLESIAKAFYKIIDRLRFLKKTWGKTVTLAHRQSYAIADDPQPSWPANTFIYDALQRVGCRYDLTLSMHLTHRLRGLDAMDAWLRLAGLYAGTNKPLKIAWNAIPFSFVVDWLYDVSSYLDGFRIPVFDGQYTLSDPCWSLKATCTARRWIQFYGAYRTNPGNTYNNYTRLFSEVQVKRFQRRPGFPPINYASIPSWFQALLGAALVWTRFR